MALPPAAWAETHLLLIASNEGTSADPPLSFAESDAARVAEALIDVGSVREERVTRIFGRGAGEVEVALELLRRRVRSSDEVVVFVSGHGDQAGVHTGGDIIAWAALRRAIEGLPARVVVAIVDACQSGALLTAKGFSRGPPLAVSIVPSGPAGHVLITSSGANELSSESILVGGSPFAQLLISAIRGAADSDRDGRVTLEETYAYVYDRTIAATLGGLSGPQHPSARFALHGAGHAVLARTPALTTTIARRAAGASDCYVLDADETRVLAELPRALLAPVVVGRRPLVVKCVRAQQIDEARVDAGAGEIIIEALRFVPKKRLFALAKGPDAQPTLGLTVSGGVWVSAQDAGRAALVTRLRVGTRAFGAGLQLTINPEGVDVALLGAGIGYVLPWLRVVRIELGVQGSAGVALRGVESLLLLGIGQFAQLDWAFDAHVALTGRVDLHQLFTVATAIPSLAVVMSVGVRFELIPSFAPPGI